MALKDIPIERIEKARASAESSRVECVAKIKDYDREIEAFVAPRKECIAQLEKQGRTLGYDADFLQIAAYLRCAVTKELSERRMRIGRLRKEAAKKSISVGKAERLCAELADAEQEMKKACPHPLVLRTDGFAGFGSCDYDDTRAGEAGCVLCGRIAMDIDCKDTNIVMRSDGSRIVERLAHHLAYDDRKALEKVIGDYLALPSADDVVEKYFGEKRIAKLTKMLRESD